MWQFISVAQGDGEQRRRIFASLAECLTMIPAAWRGGKALRRLGIKA